MLSSHHAAIVLVQKKDGSTHFCIDYWKLNPLSQITNTLNMLHDQSGLTRVNGRWSSIKVISIEQPPVHHNMGYEFKVMPFGLCNTPTT